MSEQPGRYQRSANGLIGAMILLVVLVGGYAGIQALGRDPAVTPVKTVDYAPVVGQARSEKDLYVLAPDPMPTGWRATSVSYRPGRSPTWHLGMLTDRGKYVGIEESLASEQSLVTTYVDPEATRGKSVSLRGQTWHVWTDSGGDYALVLVTPKETVLVGGSAGRAAVRRLVQDVSFGNLAA